MRENLLIVTGNPESKQLKDMLPDIIKQVGPQQYEALKNLMGDFGKKAGAKTEDDDEDDVPPLVQGTFEDASKKWTERKPWVEILSRRSGSREGEPEQQVSALSLQVIPQSRT